MKQSSQGLTSRRSPVLLTRRSLIATSLGSVAAGAWLGAFVDSVFAEGKKKSERKKDDEDDAPAPPTDVTINTDDGVQLTLTYFAGTKGKNTIPIVMLHGWKRSRNEFKAMAATLQAQGYAVILPDLRGHGESTRRRVGGREDTINGAAMPPAQFTAMVTQDMKAVKVFLWEKNNAGELNIDKLCVVGEEMGANVALNFAYFDATGNGTGKPMYGNLKLGRFVKALVLISPVWSFRGLPLFEAVKNPVVQSDIATLFLVGKQDTKAMNDAKRIYGFFEKSHPEPTTNDKDLKLAKQTLFFGKLDTNLQGDKLLDSRFHVSEIILDFLARRLVKCEEAKAWIWKERSLPYSH